MNWGSFPGYIVARSLKLTSHFDPVLISAMNGNIPTLRTRMIMASYLIGTGEYYLTCYYRQSVWIRPIKVNGIYARLNKRLL